MECEGKLDHGVLAHFWSVALVDPKGRYVIRVTIDDMVEYTLESTCNDWLIDKRTSRLLGWETLQRASQAFNFPADGSRSGRI